MNRTTDQWQALLEGTTPAPWETLREDDTPVWTIGRLGDNPARIVGDVYGEENAHLAASAPEAVAEVVRLRRELEELRDTFIQETREPHYEGDYVDGRYSGLNQATSSITRILEGENHE